MTFMNILHSPGLELLSRGGQSIFLVLSSTSKRNSLYDKLVGVRGVSLQVPDLTDATQKWQTGEISNYDYLMFLNFKIKCTQSHFINKVTNCFHFFSSDTILSSCLYLCTTEIHEYVIFSLLPW
uniref:Uncharacterized protein n=1 Tax=Amphimedon queenslandica TaxID=400682 RepID=A0A1X7TA39_AMPQE